MLVAHAVDGQMIKKQVTLENTDIATLFHPPIIDFDYNKPGNIYRILIGQINKLLDYGMSRHEILKFYEKQTYWRNHDIMHCIDIVNNYRMRHSK